MKKILLVLFIFPLLAGAACSSKTIQQTDTNDNTNKTPAVEENSGSTTDDTNINVDNDSAQQYNQYENKAVGYTILIPDKWYWQHFMKYQIEAAGANNLIDDYLVIDKNGITGLGSEYLGQIVVEKSRMTLEDLAKDKEGYSSRQVTVAGQVATRFEKQTTQDDLLFPNKRLIEYHLAKDGSTYRLMYTSEPNPEYEGIFEKVVASFSFVK